MPSNLTSDDLVRLFPGMLYVLPESAGAAVSAPETQEKEVPVTVLPVSPPPPEPVVTPEPMPEPVPVTQPVGAEPAPEPPKTRNPITWKLRAGAKVVFVMKGDEFRNKALTEFLKNQVVAALLKTEWVGFGVAENDDPDWSDIPTPFGIGFGVRAKGENLFEAPLLADAVSNPAAHGELIRILGQVRLILES